MGQFFKFLFASCLGVLLAMVVLSFIGFSMMGSLIKSADKAPAVKSNSVIEFKFNSPIPEQTNNLMMTTFDINSQNTLGLKDIIKSIENAKSDPNIKGIYLNMEFGGTGFATASSLRDALLDFKESGKFIVAYSKYYTQGSYFLASVADKVYINPVGMFDLHGISATVEYYKGVMDKVGVDVQVFWKGKYKSATEPYRRSSMSAEAKQQYREFLNPVFDDFLGDIGASRDLTVAELKQIADNLSIKTAEDAVNFGLADALAYVDEVENDIKERIGLEGDDKLNKISLANYYKGKPGKTDYSIKDKIAVVMAEGAITVGKGQPGSIGDDKYVKILQKVRKDKKIKAIVLRVNSPGGSPIASENIWREIELAKEAGKKVIVSMGDYAASGGYYISCNADKIVAEENTLTGSIGVFMMLPNVKELFTDNIGITYDTVLTTRNSVGLNTIFDLSTEEEAYLQRTVDHTYTLFKDRVSKGRNMPVDQVEEIAQGRVWTGSKAKEIGLVDELGDLQDAIAMAAEMVGLEEYRVSEYPKVKDPIQQLIEEITGQGDMVKSKILQSELGDLYPHYHEIKEMMNMKGVQAITPVRMELK